MVNKGGPITRYKAALHRESFAGIILAVAALIALIWANSPIQDFYLNLSEYEVGIEAIHLKMSIATWASDGLLAIFFFVVGLELKTEFTVGSLRDPRKAIVPIIAAVTGMCGPMLVYIAVQLATGSGAFGGWAVPVATDIAFALAVLSIFGTGLPPAARTFLMTLAVADDLLGILIIAIFFSSGINFLWLGAALVCIAVFGVLVNKRITHWWLLWPLAILAWYFMHHAGIHATIAGVALGMTVPSRPRAGEKEALTARFDSALHFWSAGIVLPIFAFFAAGVNVTKSGGLGGVFTDPVSMGIYLGLPLGKFIGIAGGVFIMIKVFKLKLGNGIDMADIVPVSFVAGVGFTVSLLIAYLSFSPSDPHEPHARVGVILGSLFAVVLGAILLRLRVAQRVRHPIEKHAIRGTRNAASPRHPQGMKPAERAAQREAQDAKERAEKERVSKRVQEGTKPTPRPTRRPPAAPPAAARKKRGQGDKK